MAEFTFTEEQAQLRDAVRAVLRRKLRRADGAPSDGVRSSVRPEGVGSARAGVGCARAVGARDAMAARAAPWWIRHWRRQPSHHAEIGEVELDLAIESGDRGVEKVSVARAAPVERLEAVRVEPGDTVENLRLNVVHVRHIGKPCSIVLHRALLELGKGLLDVHAVVGLVVAIADRDGRSSNVYAVPDLSEPFPHRSCIGGDRTEGIRFDVGTEILAERLHPARPKPDP